MLAKKVVTLHRNVKKTAKANATGGKENKKFNTRTATVTPRCARLTFQRHNESKGNFECP